MSFVFKQFVVDDQNTAMKVGTDAVLLGAWALDGADDLHAIADAGSGCGVVSLMLAQRFAKASIYSVEINAEAHEDCVKNVANSPFRDCITPVHKDFLTWHPYCLLDAIVSNPPFFEQEILPPDYNRTLARHAGGLSPLSVLDFASKHLSSHGHVAMIVPAEGSAEVVYRAEMLRLKERRRLTVFPSPGKDAVRVLLEFSRKDGPIERKELVIRDTDGTYTECYRKLLNNFYLHF